MPNSTDALTKHGLAAFAGLFPKHDPEKINEALSEINRDLAALEKADPERALRLARAIRKLTEAVNA